MKLTDSKNCNALSAVRLAFTLAVMALVPLFLYGSAPSWWAQRGVLRDDAGPDDYAAVNQGQLKNLAKAGVAEIDAKLQGGAGEGLHQLVSSWVSSSSPTDDFAPVNIGQLKNVAKPFYDRLISSGVTDFYPWVRSLEIPDDFAVANIGQAKKLFSFDIPAANVTDDVLGDRIAAGLGSANLALEPYGVYIFADRLAGPTYTSLGGLLEFASARPLAGLPVIKSVSAGQSHLAVLANDGTVWTWGQNAAGQLGNGTNEKRISPTQIVGLADVISVKAGGSHTLALKNDGTVTAWGDNSYGQLGTGNRTSTSSPVAVASLDNVRKIAAGLQRSIALKNDGSVWEWGYDYFSPEMHQDVYGVVPALVPGLTDIVAVAAGRSHAVAVKADGTVWVWGANYANQLGNGSPTITIQDAPVQVPNLPDIIKVASSYDHTLAIARDGTVWAWGPNRDGQLGNGTFFQSPTTPVQVRNLTDVIAVAAGSSFSLAMKADGTVWAWGSGTIGVLFGADKRVPQPIGIPFLDTNHNGMDDRWELRYFFVLTQTPTGDFDGDGLTNLQEFQRDTDPSDYYNGLMPLIRIVSGNEQQGAPDAYAAEPLTVQVLSQNGEPLVNAPVRFYGTTTAIARLSASRDNPDELQNGMVRTDANGYARVFCRLPRLVNAVTKVKAEPWKYGSSTSVTFVATTTTAPPPEAASNVRVSDAGDGNVAITWNDNSTNEDGFILEMQNPDGSWEIIDRVRANTTYRETSTKAINYRVRAERYGVSGPPAESNPAPVRYAIIDLGSDAEPIRVTNSGYALCQPTQAGVPQRRWYQGQFQPLTGGSDNATPGTRDIHDDGTVVGCIYREHGRVPNPLIGTASQSYGPDAWYRRDVTYAVPARWSPSSSTAQVLATPVFSFNVGQTPDEGYTGTVSNSATAITIADNGSIYGGAFTAYQDVPAYLDSADSFVGARWASAISGFNYTAGQALGDQTVLSPSDGFVVSGQPFFVLKARGGSTIGSVSDDPDDARYLNDSLRDFQPINLNSRGDALILTEDIQPRYQWYEVSTETRTDVTDPGLTVFNPEGQARALNHRSISVTDDSGQTASKVSPQIVGYYTLSRTSAAAIWEENPKTGKYEMESLNRLISPTSGWNLQYAMDINDNGIIVGTGLYADPSTPGAPPQTHGFMLVRAGLMVDGNRDGEMSFDDPTVHYADQTSEEKPYRFWVNDDDDGAAGDPGEHVPPSAPDYNDGTIRSTRDLEDFSRLHLNVSGLETALESGTVKAALGWRNNSGNPRVKLYRARSGGIEYLTNESAAASSTLFPFRDTLGEVASGVPLFLPQDFWVKTSQISNVPKTLPIAWLLFEGSGEGKGELVLSFWKEGRKMGEAPGIWLELKNVKKLYQHETLGGPDPWRGVAFEPAAEEEQQVIVFVHGWRLSPDDSANFAETMFKRVWWRGFKGRFAAVRWDTYYNTTDHGWLPYVGQPLDAYLAKYNDSEHNAWLTGPALKAFIDRLPADYTKDVIAHSMGNVVTGAALQKGLAVRNYALLNAALPASCYDDDEKLKQAATSVMVAGLPIHLWNQQTPEDDPDSFTRALAYRGRLKGAAGNLVSFYLPDDHATSFAWEMNNALTKPPSASLGGRFVYRRDFPSGQKLIKGIEDPNTDEVIADYYLTDQDEADAYACRTWGKAVGAESRTAGRILDKIDLSSDVFSPGRTGGFAKEHSAEFNYDIQMLEAFYAELLTQLDILPTP